jgi:hypothetical protein
MDSSQREELDKLKSFYMKENTELKAKLNE